jgi:GntR family carbon starvation induced transcriptional regulator
VKNLATKCLEIVEDKIIMGKLRPGEHIKIDALAASLGVGLSPMREALSRLSASRLVENKDKRGFFVTALDADTVRDSMLTIYQIESLVVGSAMQHGDDRWEQNIVATLHGLKKVETEELVSVDKWLPRNEAFHDAIAAGCPLKRLLAIRNELKMEHRRFTCFAFAQNDISSLAINHDEHRLLAESILARKKKAAMDFLKHHLIGDLEAYLKAFEKPRTVE